MLYLDAAGCGRFKALYLNSQPSFPLSKALADNRFSQKFKNIMQNTYILIDLDKEQKAVISDKASFFVQDRETKEDLDNSRKKWIRFQKMALPEVIGELSYHFNRSENQYESMILDELIMHLEYYEKNT